MKQNAIHTIETLRRKDFPALLREIPDPPSRLFIRGTFPSDTSVNELHVQKNETKFLCVVGSRRVSGYGADVCRTLIADLGRHPAGRAVVIVSGLALGVDGIAHESALKAGLRTIAVLGSGLDWESVYPRAHVNLAKEIIASGGAIISELPEGYKPYKSNFPERNRIMAGLSHATLVIEAGEKSGTLITARLALDYNRDVFAVPGSIFSDQSLGAHTLISDGAMLVQNARDILRGLGINPERSDKVATTSSTGETTVETSLYIEDLSGTERLIYMALTSPCTRVEFLMKLSVHAVLSTSAASAALSSLEMKGLIVESGEKIRRKT